MLAILEPTELPSAMAPFCDNAAPMPSEFRSRGPVGDDGEPDHERTYAQHRGKTRGAPDEPLGPSVEAETANHKEQSVVHGGPNLVGSLSDASPRDQSA